MAGVADTVGLRLGAIFELASPGDEPNIRQLLAQNPMPGKIRISQEPAPAASLGDGIPCLSHHSLIARDGDGNIAAIGTRRVSRMMINGEPQSVGYLGSLRVASCFRQHPRFLLNGYAALRELHESLDDCRFYLTSIFSENLPARRFLEAGLCGMPIYRQIADFVTLVMRVRREMPGPSQEIEFGKITELLKRNRDQFAPVWSDEELSSNAAFCVNGDSCGALWDQNSFRQSIVRGYSRTLSRLRPFVNGVSRLLGRPTLPAVNEPLRIGFVSRLAIAHSQQATEIVTGLHHIAWSKNIRYLIAGFDERDPRLAILRRAFGGVELRSRLYAVYWQDGVDAVNGLDDRIVDPEVGTLNLVEKPQSNIAGELISRADLSQTDRERMFNLLTLHFAGVSHERFESDLAEKNWVLLLRERGGRIVGFSTLTAYETSVTGFPVNVVYSGDTIVDPCAWSSTALPRQWLAAINRLRPYYPTAPWMWLLITSGFRTYRLLSTFWKEFWPRYDRPTPPQQLQMLNDLANERFRDHFDPETGIVRLANPQILRSHLAGVPQLRMQDPHVAFFARANSDHGRGDELACLCDLELSNLNRAGLRMLGPVSNASR